MSTRGVSNCIGRKLVLVGGNEKRKLTGVKEDVDLFAEKEKVRNY